MDSLGDILHAALQKETNMFYDVTIEMNRGDGANKIADIKALRAMTRLPSPDNLGACMSLTDAKNAIEHMYANGSAIIRLTPEHYAAWSYNAFISNPVVYARDWRYHNPKLVFPNSEAFFTV